MKKRGSFFGGLIVFVLVIIILGGVGYLGYNIINNSNGMPGMNMASNGTTNSANSTDASSTNSNTSKDTSSTKATASNDTSATNSNTTANSNTSASVSTYKINQINQVMMNKDVLDKAVNTINSAIKDMTLDPYAANTDKSHADQKMNNDQQSNTNTDTQSNTTVNIYTAPTDQTVQMQNMGTTYDPDKMQQLHSGLFKVSVGMQLLNQLQQNVDTQIAQAGIDSKSLPEYYLNQYYTTIQNKNKLNEALNYISDAVDLININPYEGANGLVYDEEKMTQMHDSIYQIAQGVVDLNKLNDDLLTQAVKIGSLAQDAYSQAQTDTQSNSNSMSNMNMNTDSVFGLKINTSTILSFVLIAFVVIFILALLGSIFSLFKTTNHPKVSADQSVE